MLLSQEARVGHLSETDEIIQDTAEEQRSKRLFHYAPEPSLRERRKA
jgi:hypothetical protein